MISRPARVRGTRTHNTLLAVVAGAVAALCATALDATPAQAAPAWTVASVANPHPVQAHAQFQSVSCPSSTFCLAGGSHVGIDGRYAPLSETFNGTSWHVASTSAPGSGADGFGSVSCTDKTFCMATTYGNSVARVTRWTGAKWIVQTLGSAKVTALFDVKCRSHTMCMAVGLVGNQAAAWHYNGKGWYRQTLPSPTQHSLTAVSCPSATVCYAAGSTNSSTNQTSAYVVRWNGTSWHASSLPKAFGSIDDIACLSTTRCTAVGSGGQFGDHVLVVDLAGGTWKYSSVKTTTAAPTGIAVACTSSACTAILNYETPDDSVATSIAVRGTTGGFVKSAQSFPDLSGLSCAGSSCIVVGSTLVIDRGGLTIGDQPTPATAYRRHGNKLTKFTVAQPDGRTPNGFTAVSCSGGVCAAIDDPGTSGALWLRASAGAAWQPVAGTANLGYTAVSCTSTTFCMAVGRGHSRSYNGSTWTAHTIPQPQGNNKDDIFAVSCVSPIWCEAVGTTGVDGNEGKILAVHWSGASWAVDHIGATTLTALDGISCTSIDDCLAVGYQLGGNEPKPIVETLHQATWAVEATTGLPSTTSLEDVSCWSATGCMVTSPGDFGAPTTATWNGTSFTDHPIIGDNPSANAVSCTAADSCTIGGVYFGVSQDGSQLVENWNGTAWHIVAQPTVLGDQPAYDGISCAPSGSCTAVGSVGRAYTIALTATGTV